MRENASCWPRDWNRTVPLSLSQYLSDDYARLHLRLSSEFGWFMLLGISKRKIFYNFNRQLNPSRNDFYDFSRLLWHYVVT